ncbi:hypothetical protein BCR37DRAFT_382389 [Protomyces lactucae-debilis]|uniref:DNA-directed RNA polymerase n=1 Tax=Protomyces lactucae-debilis TaxID=2754530 RepID=A0A1Y2F2L7_PROLT|nr:uncharacterized protein BCR37DRAFT_382389 [Protomyces lactucae-debilis]ORY78130.1 hypothetical protein BCR37DRAFT_382389 [Protomyces lactucae-debilis]
MQRLVSRETWSFRREYQCQVCRWLNGLSLRGRRLMSINASGNVQENATPDGAAAFSAFPPPSATPRPADLSPKRFIKTTNMKIGRRNDLVKLPTPALRDNYRGIKQRTLKNRTTPDALALFDACVVTGNWGRSLKLLEQVRNQADDATVLVAVNRYLQALVEEVPTSQQMTFAQKHFDEYDTKWGVLPNHFTFALMCKGNLALQDGEAAKVAIQELARHWQSIKGDFGTVMAADVLTQDEARRAFVLSGLDYRLIGKENRSSIEIPQHPLSEVDEVLPPRQPPPGLGFLKHSLSALTDQDVEIVSGQQVLDDSGRPLSTQEIFNLARQKSIEENAVDAAVMRWKHDHDALKKRGRMTGQVKSLNVLFWEWKEEMVPLIQEEVDRIDHSSDDLNRPSINRQKQTFSIPQTEKEAEVQALRETMDSDASRTARRDYGPFLGLLKPEKLAAVTILEVIRSFTTENLDGMKSATLVVKVGKAIENEYHAEILKKKGMSDTWRVPGQNIQFKHIAQDNELFKLAVRRARAKAQQMNASGLFHPEWTQQLRAKIGAVMVSFLLHTARISMTKKGKSGFIHRQEAPAFFHSYQYSKGQRLGVIKLNDQLMQRLSSEPLRGSIYPRQLPMLTPPRPWYSYDSGGYLCTRTFAMRAKNSPEQIRYLKSASERGHLDNVLSALDILGKTPWSINEQVFKCALQAWNSGHGVADIPPAELDINLPPPPPADADPTEKFVYKERCKEITTLLRNCASMRSDINYKLEIARAFLHDTMYFPHSLDFRGRAYPIPPHFNHLGNDLCRGLLLFGTAKELGPSGLRWLKIHFANHCGHDKASFDEREAFADESLEKIFEAADHPMDGTQWWLEADKPWQCLAACFELTKALRSGNPEKYKCALPVHQDGTCNGLQHYAALGGDLSGAKQVNLEPSDRPQDVYRGVADLVNIQVNIDAAAGEPRAKKLQGHISRKVVKQTVMTNVYGVTFIGARLQIENQLKDLKIEGAEDEVWDLANYLVKKVFKALNNLFTGAHEIQDWLKHAAMIVTRSVHKDALLNAVPDTMSAVIWTTPLDLPVVQPYRKEVRRQIMTNLQTVFISDPSDAAEVNSRKQAAAFPPNFIHSLDATHMLMSALVCQEEDVTFAAVHDSYWTHAADTDKMNVILRDAFIKLHSQDIMGDLHSEFKQRYSNHFLPVPSIQKFSQAYAFCMKPEHLESGKVVMLPGQKGVVVQDHDLAIEVLRYGARAGAVNPESIDLSSHARNTQTLAERMKTREYLEELDKTSAESEAQQEEETAVGADVQEAPSKPKREAKSKRLATWAVWVPISFPPLPKKGDFDVTKLKQSKYFFS